MTSQIAILNGASIPGRIIPSFIADKTGAYNALIPVSFAIGVLIFGILGIGHSVAAVTIFTILYGFFVGASQSPPSSLPCLGRLAD